MPGASGQLRSAEPVDDDHDDGANGRQVESVGFACQCAHRIRQNIGKAPGAGFLGG